MIPTMITHHLIHLNLQTSSVARACENHSLTGKQKSCQMLWNDFISAVSLSLLPTERFR